MDDWKTYTVYDISDLHGQYMGTAFTRNELIEFTGPGIHSRNEDGHWNIADPDSLGSCQGFDDVNIGFNKDISAHMRLCDQEFLDMGIRIYPTRNKNQRTWLVRGVGKRAIKVSSHTFTHLKNINLTRDQIIVKAAIAANKRGWKKVFVGPDGGEGEYAEIFNTAMINRFYNGDIAGGISLCYVGHTEN